MKAKLLELPGDGNFAVASTLATELIEKKPQDAVMHAKLATLSFFAGNTKIALESARRSIGLMIDVQNVTPLWAWSKSTPMIARQVVLQTRYLWSTS